MNINSCCVFNWNIARNTDYLALCLRTKEKSWKSVLELSERRRQKLTEIFKSTITDYKPDFFCIQESDGLSQLSEFLGTSYDAAMSYHDCAIAWDKEKYVKVNELHKERYSVVTLKNLECNKVIRIASAHLSGFDLSDPQEKNELMTAPISEKGDKELGELANILTQEKADLYILGMDANSTPDIHPERLQIVENLGFNRFSEESLLTSYNDSVQKQVQLDYVYVKEGICRTLEGFDYPIDQPLLNPSDHKPLMFTIIQDTFF